MWCTIYIVYIYVYIWCIYVHNIHGGDNKESEIIFDCEAFVRFSKIVVNSFFWKLSEVVPASSR